MQQTIAVVGDLIGQWQAIVAFPDTWRGDVVLVGCLQAPIIT